MIGPPVKLLRKTESQGRYGSQYDLEFEILGDVEGRREFWMDESEGIWLIPHLFFKSVNPKAAESLVRGKTYQLIFKPTDLDSGPG